MTCHLILALVFLVVLSGCADAQSPADSQPSNQNSFADPESIVGKYPGEIMVSSGLETRIRRLLGGAYEGFDQAFNGPQGPVTMESTEAGHFIELKGCMAHNCSDINALVVLEADSNTLHVAVQRNGQVTTYSENPEQTVETCRWFSLMQGDH